MYLCTYVLKYLGSYDLRTYVPAYLNRYIGMQVRSWLSKTCVAM